MTMDLLIVEDNGNMRGVLRDLLQSVCDPIYESKTGEEAVSAYEKKHPDLVLMDIVMPVMDGIEATRRIQASDPAARICIVTDYDEQELRHAARDAGAEQYFLKENLLGVLEYVRTMAGGAILN